MIRAAAAGVLLVLAACAPGRVVPVAGSCVPESLGAAPAYADPDSALLAAPDAAERFRLLVIGREQRMGRLAALEGVVRACRVGESASG